MRGFLAVALAVALAIAVPAPAYAAASVTLDTDSINYQFTSGAVGDVVAIGVNAGQVYIDSEHGVTSSDCAQTIETQVACDARPTINFVLSPYGDHLNVGTVPAGISFHVSAGAGNDEVTGSPNNDVLDCGAGTDTAHAQPGDTLISCEIVTGLPKVSPVYAFKVSAKNAQGVLVNKFKIRNLAAGDQLDVKCSGATCPFKSEEPKVSGSKVKLVKLFKDERVGKIKVKIRITRDDAIGALRTYKVSKQGEVTAKSKCLVPGVTKPRAC